MALQDQLQNPNKPYWNPPPGNGYGFYADMSTLTNTGAPYAASLVTDVAPPGDWPILVGDDTGLLPVPTSLKRTVTAMSAIPGGDVVAADSSGALYRFDGTSLILTAAQVTKTPYAIKAFADDDWVVAGKAGSVFRVQGATVTALPTGAGADLVAVDGPSASAFEVGGAGFLMRYDGTTFQLESLQGGTDVRALRRSADGQVVAAGKLGAVAIGQVGGVLRKS